MAAQSNGRAKKPKKPTANGHMNGQADKSTISNTGARSLTTRGTPRRTITASFINVAGRLVTWYILITIFFRCPSSLSHLSDASPRICRPYLHASSYAAPYVDPYYQAYLAPQVEKLQPYVDHFDSQVYTPLAAFTKDKYATYGAHRVESAQNFLEAEWDKSIRPQLQNIQGQVKGQYDLYLGPYVKQLTDNLEPHYVQTKESLVEIYHLTILPAYEVVLPYSHKAYIHGHHVVSHIVFPYVRYAKDTVLTFLTRTLWPQVRVLYGDNVEPQLVRIRERLGRYNDQQKIESIVEVVESETAVSPEPFSTTEFVSTTASPSLSSATGYGWNVFDQFWPADSSSTSNAVDVKTATAPDQPKLTGAELRESLNNDLRKWQSKFATAADKGAEDLEQRVEEITSRQVENGIRGHGSALVVQLEEAAKSTIEKFKRFIQETVQTVSEESTEEELESAYAKCLAKTRELGVVVKEKAQAVRTWKANYDQETDNFVRAAVDSTLAVLERIHSLGLQEVGMRWAWTDGVTYKDWKNYHKLRHTLTEWKDEVAAVGSRHEGLRIAHEEAKNLEDKAMRVGSDMVKELVRLKEVAKWKIWAGDATNDFSDRKVPVRVFKAVKNVASSVEDVSSKASEAILGSDTPASRSIASAVKDQVADSSSKVSESMTSSDNTASNSVVSNVEGILAEASLQSAIGSESHIPSVATDIAQATESLVQQAEKKVEDMASVATESPKVYGGAMAQVIAEAKEIVLDDIIDDDQTESFSRKMQSIVGDAEDRAAELTKIISEALLKPSRTQGSVESVTSLASEKYEKAVAAASSVLYGAEQQPIESVTSVASEKFAQAVTAASYAIYGTPTPTAIIKTVHTEANSRYNEAISIANEQFSNAKSQLQELISGTPKPAHETLLSMINKAYSDSVEAASQRLEAALQYTDSVKSYASGPNQGYFESVSSVASSNLDSALSAASAQLRSQPTPVLEGARRQYYEAVGLAHARYSEFLDACSTAVYGPHQGTFESVASLASGSAESVVSDMSASPQSIGSKIGEVADSLSSQISSSLIGTETSWAESAASQASQNWEALIARLSMQVYGAPTPWTESVYSQAGAYGAQATAQVVAQYDAVSALISELVVGKEPDFTESVLSRFSSAYYTGLPDAVQAASSYASESYESATAYVESVVGSVFTPPPAIETILSQASEQIESAMESASIAVYGTPKGKVEEASESVASAYSLIQSKASEAIYGTQQVQDSFAAIAGSAQAAISEAIYGPPSTAPFAASVTSGAESVYSSVSSAASKKAADAASAISSAVYGPEQGAIESARSRLAVALDAANSRINEMYANAAKTVEEATSGASSVVNEATQKVRDEL
ncbi:hypothetical protein CC78DRAFT_544316 [Lojkania enalia]|uniref:Transcription factor hoxa13 n=1 Tax=Lojkania enalia TaxID=147567 RepID=A0A9P4K8P5_9PLEO|nr:hypothetical protein CC78DRAFT_544316 [Didymosphaeria enalia]